VIANGIPERGLLRLAAAVERSSEHPLAEAVVRRADGAGASALDAQGFENVPASVRGPPRGERRQPQRIHGDAPRRARRGASAPGGADGHFAVAAEVHKRIGAPVFLARTRLAWASSLLAQGSALAAMRARRLLEQAAADARARSRRRDAPDRGGAQPGRRHRGRASRGLRRWDQVPPHARGTGTIGAEVIGRLPGLA
jgi:hypothetical protein